MKSLFWIILVLLVPFSATAQTQLFFHATIDLPLTGTTDDTTGGCSVGGEPITPISGDILVTFSNTLPLIAGENQGTLNSPIVNMRIMGGGVSAYSGTYTFQYDPQSHTLYNLQITVAGQDSGSDVQTEINFAISLDSISLGLVSASNWSLAASGLPCLYSSNYYNQYLMMTGALGWQKASSQGQTTLVNLDASTAGVGVSAEVPSSNIEITYLANGSVEIECSQSSPSEVAEIFDALGHLTLRATMDGNVAQISNLPPGFYFARLGDQVAKFIVPPR
jgi:hypothetical protein